MVKYFELKDCGEECPYFIGIDLGYEHSKSGVCKKVKAVIKNIQKDGFPKWCPLDDPNDL